MKFQAFQCACGYNLVSAGDTPTCPDCGKKMEPMPTDGKRYKKFNKELKSLFK